MQVKLYYLLWLLVLGFAAYAEANTLRTCHSCQGIECQRTTTQSQTQKCSDALDYCVTVFEQSQVLYKGCSLELPIAMRRRCDANIINSECHKCNFDYCNNVGARRYSCLQCDSSKDAKCLQSPTALMATQCVAPTAPNSYCFVYAASDGAVQRGCATTVAEQKKCFEDRKCQLCSPGAISNCNNVNLSSAKSLLLNLLQ